MAPLVLLLREPDDPDPYEEALRAAGFRARSVPVLAFRFVNAGLLREAFARSEQYSGLVATSPRAVAAVKEAVHPVEIRSWLGKRVYTVGPAMAEHLELLGLETMGAEAGSAEALAAVIAQEFSRRVLNFEDQDAHLKPLLFLTGNRTREVLPERLRAENIPFEPLLVYETLLRPDLDFGSPVPPDWVVFFSPSGVHAVEGGAGLDLKAVRVAAIGPTTAEALTAAGLPPDAVAVSPSPSALAEALAQHP